MTRKVLKTCVNGVGNVYPIDEKNRASKLLICIFSSPIQNTGPLNSYPGGETGLPRRSPV